MTEYTVRYTVPAEVVVRLDADSHDDAEDRAWQIAQDYLDTLLPDRATGASIHADLDGIGADSVEVAP